MKQNDRMLEDLKLLFEFVPPQDLKANLNFLLLQYLMSMPKDHSPPKEFYENLFFLFRFLDKMEKSAKAS